MWALFSRKATEAAEAAASLYKEKGNEVNISAIKYKLRYTDELAEIHLK